MALIGRLFGGLLLGVLDLLEDLAHAGSHELALRCQRLVIATPVSLGLPRVEILLVHRVDRPADQGSRQGKPALQSGSAAGASGASDILDPCRP